MRSQNFIFILVLLTINLTNTFDFTSFVELNDLQNDPYAKSLIETIQMSMKGANGGRIENIQSLLDDLLIKLINDQKNADAVWGKEKARLDNKISNLNNDIAKLTAEIAQLNKEKQDNENKRDLSRRNIVQYTAQRLADQTQLKDLAVRRQRDRAIYEASVKEHAAIIGAIEQVVAALQRLRGSVSGIGKPKHVGAIANENRDAAWKAGVKKSFVEIVGDDEEANAFVELATEADQAALEKLIALLNNVEKNTKKSLADDEDAEVKSVQSFNRLNANLNGDVQSLDSLLKRQQANLDGYLKRINDLTLTINIRTSLLHSRQLELKNTIQERHDKLNQYNADTAHRTQEKSTIQRLQRIVKDRLATMTKFLRPHVNK
jgi:septal ring factor EnvC (AmiA/AmiB activator)